VPFSGTFDGNGHTLYSMNVESDAVYTDGVSVDYAVGMFGVLKGVVKNLTVDSLSIRIDSETVTESSCSSLLSRNTVTDFDVHVGLIGINKGNVENVSVTADFDVSPATSSARVRIGGIAGKNSDSVRNCRVDGTLRVVNSDGYIRAGGIAGYVSSNGKIISAGADVEIYAEITDGAKMNLGGIAGNVECGKISDCYAKGSIVGKNTDLKAVIAGGLVGLIDNTDAKYADMSVTVTESFSETNVTATGGKAYAAGFIGQIDFDNAVTVTDNGCTGSASGSVGSFGFVGRIRTLLGTVLSSSDFENGTYGGILTVLRNESTVYDDFAANADGIEIPEKYRVD
ncbi:MAG: GLUG motif-containing protein, partial [Christensenellales bacterium]